MILPLEVWALILPYLSYNDLIKASAVCKCFYDLTRKNSGFIKKLTNSRALFSGVNLYEQYKDVCLPFAPQIHFGLKKVLMAWTCFCEQKMLF